MEEAWALSAALLAALRDTVAADGARLVVAIVPPHMAVQNDDWRYSGLLRESGHEWDLLYPQQRMLALLDRSQIPTLNPTRDFVELRAKTARSHSSRSTNTLTRPETVGSPMPFPAG